MHGWLRARRHASSQVTEISVIQPLPTLLRLPIGKGINCPSRAWHVWSISSKVAQAPSGTTAGLSAAVDAILPNPGF